MRASQVVVILSLFSTVRLAGIIVASFGAALAATPAHFHFRHDGRQCGPFLSLKETALLAAYGEELFGYATP